MADYTPEQVEKLAEFARRNFLATPVMRDHAARLGLTTPDGALAD